MRPSFSSRAARLFPRAAAGVLGLAALALANNYTRPKEPPIPPALIPLPMSALSLQGWTAEYAKVQKQAMLEAAKAIFVFYKNKEANYWMQTTAGGDWGPEAEVYWLEGMIKLSYLMKDKELKDSAMKRIEKVFERVNAVGRIGPTSHAWNDYFSNHMGYGLLQYYFDTRDPRVIEAYNKAFQKADLVAKPLVDRLGVFQSCFLHNTNRPRYVTEIMAEMYSLGGADYLLEYAKKQWTELDPIVTKHVLSGEAFKTMWEHGFSIESFLQNYLVGYQFTGRKDYLDVALALRNHQKTHNRQPHGGITSGEWFNGTGGFKKSEICGMAPNFQANHWYLRVLGEGQYADEMEGLFFNGAMNSIDSNHLGRYFSAPNHIRGEFGGGLVNYPDTRSVGYNVRAGAYVFCCAGSKERFFPGYMNNTWFATPDDGLAAVLYAPSRLSQVLVGDGVKISIDQATEYPFDETITFTLSPEKEVDFPLYLRIPAWCQSPSVKVNGAGVPAARDAKGFVKIARAWQAGDKVELKLPMVPRVLVDREVELLKPDSFQVEGGFGCLRKDGRCLLTYEKQTPYASVFYGPFLYGTFGDPVGTTVPEWRYAYAGNPGQAGTAIEVLPAVKKSWRWPIKTAVRPLRLKLQKIDWKIAAGPEWNPEHTFNSGSPAFNTQIPDPVPVDGAKLESVELYPMGASQYKVSMFPLTQGVPVGLRAGALKAAGPGRSHRLRRGKEGLEVLLSAPERFQRFELRSAAGKLIATGPVGAGAAGEEIGRGGAEAEGAGNVQGTVTLKGRYGNGLFVLRLVGPGASWTFPLAL